MSRPPAHPLALWSSPSRFFLAALGALGGMDTFSEFPYLMTHYGGLAFVAVYMGALLAVAWPLLAAELAFGRRQRLTDATAGLAQAVSGRLGRWALGAAVLGGFLMFCYVAVVTGWILSYLPMVLGDGFRAATPSFLGAYFDHMVAAPGTPLAWEAFFLLLVFLVLGGGVRAIEDLAYVLMPGLLALFVVLILFAASSGSFFVSAPFFIDQGAAPLPVLLIALSQAFFGPGLGTASFLAYGTFLPGRVSPGKITLALLVAQTLAATLGGFALASLVFSAGLRPLAGGAFLFETLPLVSARLTHGVLVVALCYGGLVAAAWLSAVAWLEPAMQIFAGRGISRLRAAWGLGLTAFVIGVVLTLSLKSWAFSFTFFGRLKTFGLLDVLMILAVNVLLPVGAGGLSARMGWDDAGFLGMGRRFGVGRLWPWLLRILVPTLVLVVIVSAPRLIL